MPGETPAVSRLLDGPIVHRGLDPSLGDNINGPSLIRVPGWVPDPLGRYYLYFAHHEGRHIRLAVADALTGPWRVHAPGALHLSETPLPQSAPPVPEPASAMAQGDGRFFAHIASPDVHVGDDLLTMYFHGLAETGDQVSLVATSADGLRWQVAPQRIAQTYLRVFAHRGTRYAIAWGGQVLRAAGQGFEPGPWPFPEGHRHAAVLVRGDTLHVLWTRIGDAPERILHSVIDLRAHWRDWRVAATADLLRPERAWEGADLPVEPSRIGIALAPEHALRDPCLFEEDGRLYLVYAGAGEQALGIAEITGL